jgi:GT2 family glycosyltransferase
LKHTKRFISSLKRFTPIPTVFDPKQPPIEWELISVDSGSTDGTREYLTSEYRNGTGKGIDSQYGTITHSENVGWIKGINSALSHVSKETDILIFCNNDIVLDSPGWLERLCKHFENPTVGAVGPTSNYVIGRQHTSCNVPAITEEETKTLVGLFFAVRKEIVDQIGPLEEDFWKYVPDESDEVRERLKLGGAMTSTTAENP